MERPVRASGSSPFISHLFFPDDLILFAKASCEQAKFLKRCLDLFCELSGQEVSSLQVFGWHGKISRICISALTSILGKTLTGTNKGPTSQNETRNKNSSPFKTNYDIVLNFIRLDNFFTMVGNVIFTNWCHFETSELRP